MKGHFSEWLRAVTSWKSETGRLKTKQIFDESVNIRNGASKRS